MLGINFNNIKTLISQEFTTSEVSSYSAGTTELTLKYEIKAKELVKKKPVEEKNEKPIVKEVRIDTDKDGIFDEDDDCPNLFGSNQQMAALILTKMEFLTHKICVQIL